MVCYPRKDKTISGLYLFCIKSPNFMRKGRDMKKT